MLSSDCARFNRSRREGSFGKRCWNSAIASVEAQSGTTRDLRSKTALQVAESGVDQALLRYNTYADTGDPLNDAFPCITADGGRASTSGGWCAGVTAGDGAGTATYYVKPTYTVVGGTSLPASLEIVSVGAAGPVETKKRAPTAAAEEAEQSDE